MAGPLKGLRIIDMSSVLMGPYAAMQLGELGAQVIKVEPPQGDTSRLIGPAKHPGMSGGFVTNNFNKRGIVLDIKSPEGRDTLLRLTDAADVLLFNLRPKVMARLRMTYEDVSRTNPRIIYCGISGFGQGGPYSDKPAYDDLIQASVGIPWLQEKAGIEPSYAPLVMADRIGSLMVTQAILAALYHRERSGEGQAVQVPMFESLAHLVLSDHMGGEVFVPPAGELGSKRVLSRQRRPFKTKNGLICLMPYTDKHCRALFNLFDRPELIEDPRFVNLTRRTENIDALYKILRDTLPSRTCEEWIAMFDQADIPAAKVNSITELMQDPHLQATGFFQTLEHPTEGALRAMRSPVSFSRTSPQVSSGAPTLGQHTAQVMSELAAR